MNPTSLLTLNLAPNHTPSYRKLIPQLLRLVTPLLCLLFPFPELALGQSRSRYPPQPCLGPVRAPPTLGHGPALRPLEALASEAVTGLQLVKSRRLPLFAGTESGFWHTFPCRQYWYFFPVTRESAHILASCHFSSEISRLRCARDLGRGIGRLPYRFVNASILPRKRQVLCRELGPLVSLLVPWNALVGWAPPDLNGDVRSGSPKRRNAARLDWLAGGPGRRVRIRDSEQPC